MAIRVLGLAVLVAFLCFGGPKGPVTKRGENSRFVIEATLYKDYEEVSQLLGVEVEQGIVAVAVKLTPKGDDPYEIWRDDFMLRSDKDGQKSTPYDPGQIAGSTVIKLVYTMDGGGNVAQEQRGPTWGGMGGSMPQRLPGGPGGVGNTAGVEQASGSKVEEDASKKENPQLLALRERVLEEKKLTEDASGLLYYPLEGKHKTKQIWLHYVGRDGEQIDLQFKPD